ncbi:DUF397 domain-containing protein [Nonomuraea sp. NPDC050663]|uniref:DUF397 domain-containing protein n=1 Tax=Nonomuraea sp. NPDC050663 TaxID=3364370 RepID=UPI0037B87656
MAVARCPCCRPPARNRMSNPRELDLLTWHSASCNSGACIEVARSEDRVLIRDSKQANGTVLQFSEEEWTTFCAGVRSGTFDRI